MNWQQGEFSITDERTDINSEMVHRFLRDSYWARGVRKDVVERSIDNALCFGLLHGTEQIGFARVITDRATFAYLSDVFVIEQYRGRGLGKWLVSCVLSHPHLQGLRRWMLATADAHGLYEQFGFTPLGRPKRFMEISARKAG